MVPVVQVCARKKARMDLALQAQVWKTKVLMYAPFW